MPAGTVWLRAARYPFSCERCPPIADIRPTSCYPDYSKTRELSPSFVHQSKRTARSAEILHATVCRSERLRSAARLRTHATSMDDMAWLFSTNQDHSESERSCRRD